MKRIAGSIIWAKFVTIALLFSTSCSQPISEYRVANETERIAVFDEIAQRAENQNKINNPNSSVPVQKFCMNRAFFGSFEDLSLLDLKAISTNHESSDAFATLVKSGSIGSSQSNLSQYTIPPESSAYPPCPRDTERLDRDGLFYSHNTENLGLPYRAGNFIFLETAIVCGPLCGSGSVTILQKNWLGQWRVVERISTWIS